MKFFYEVINMDSETTTKENVSESNPLTFHLIQQINFGFVIMSTTPFESKCMLPILG